MAATPTNNHRLIVGISASGKTTLAEFLARRSRQPKIIYTPTGEFDGVPNSEIFLDAKTFLARVYIAAREKTGAEIFIDEADTVISHKDAPPHRWIMQRGRHFGFAVTLISQRANLIDTTCRYMAREAFVFRSAPADLKAVAPIFALKEINADIPMRQFLWLRPQFSTPEFYQLKIRARGGKIGKAGSKGGLR